MELILSYVNDRTIFPGIHPESKSLSKAVELGRKSKENTYTNLRLAIKKGVKVGVGTDYVGFPPDFSAREFGELVKLGMTPMQAIQAGTKVNAELLKKEADLGTIEAGKLADIIAVKGIRSRTLPSSQG